MKIKGGCMWGHERRTQKLPIRQRKSGDSEQRGQKCNRRNGLYLGVFLYALRLIRLGVEQEEQRGCRESGEKLLE